MHAAMKRKITDAGEESPKTGVTPQPMRVPPHAAAPSPGPLGIHVLSCFGPEDLLLMDSAISSPLPRLLFFFEVSPDVPELPDSSV